MADNPDEGVSFPFLELCGITRPQLGGGHCIAVVEPHPKILNSLGIAHGGLVATLADAAMGGAARSALAAQNTVVTVTMQTSYFAPAKGRLEAEAHVVKRTRALVFAECEVRNGAGDAVARSSGVFRVLDRARFVEPSKS
ncbi:MAG: PaaI family thioesterase [Beijerinckiaceae bacterium]